METSGWKPWACHGLTVGPQAKGFLLSEPGFPHQSESLHTYVTYIHTHTETSFLGFHVKGQWGNGCDT